MKYHNWIKYGQNGMILEIIVRDGNGSKIEGFKINTGDRKSLKKILRILKDKYSIDLSNEIKKEDKDLHWLK